MDLGKGRFLGREGKIVLRERKRKRKVVGWEGKGRLREGKIVQQKGNRREYCTKGREGGMSAFREGKNTLVKNHERGRKQQKFETEVANKGN